MNLYQLSKDFSKAAWEYENAETEEDRDKALQALWSLEGDVNEKLSNCCGYVKSLARAMESVGEEIDKLRERKEMMDNAITRMKVYMMSCLEVGERWEMGPHKLRWNTSESVEIVDESKVPEQYMKEKITRSPDKTSIKADLKRDVVIPECSLKTKIGLVIG